MACHQEEAVIRANASVVLPGAETNICMRCLFVVGDAKIVLAPPDGIEKLVSFGQVTAMRWWEVQGQAGGSSNASFPRREQQPPERPGEEIPAQPTPKFLTALQA